MRRAITWLHELPPWVHAYAGLVLVLWTYAVISDYESNAITVGAFVLALPAGAGVFVLHLLVFTLLGFDATAPAPQWQNVVTHAALVLGMTAAALLNATLFRSLARAIRGRAS